MVKEPEDSSEFVEPEDGFADDDLLSPAESAGKEKYV